METRKNQGLFGKGLTHDKILHQSKFKSIADESTKQMWLKKLEFVQGIVENIVGKGEKA